MIDTVINRIVVGLVHFILIFSTSVSYAQNEAGVALGTATGFSGLLSTSSNRAIDIGLAYSTNSVFNLYADYLITNARLIKAGQVPLNLYYGLGFRLQNINSGKNDGKTAIGPRAPVGLTYLLNNPDVTFFTEVAPVLDIIPETSVEVMLEVGARIRF